MKYVVAKGNCFYNDGNIYDAGDVITKSIFKPESAFDDAVSKGKIIAVEEKLMKLRLMKIKKSRKLKRNPALKKVESKWV